MDKDKHICYLFTGYIQRVLTFTANNYYIKEYKHRYLFLEDVFPEYKDISDHQEAFNELSLNYEEILSPEKYMDDLRLATAMKKLNDKEKIFLYQNLYFVKLELKWLKHVGFQNSQFLK
ncbi:hypothetical protein ACEVRU_001756 [Listeria monocytogenes]